MRSACRYPRQVTPGLGGTTWLETIARIRRTREDARPASTLRCPAARYCAVRPAPARPAWWRAARSPLLSRPCPPPGRPGPARPPARAARPVPAGRSSGRPGPSAACPAPATAAGPGSAEGPLVIHVRDARTGEMDIFAGTTRTRLVDPALAAPPPPAGGWNPPPPVPPAPRRLARGGAPPPHPAP